MQKVNLSAVSYLNTKPFVYGLTHGPVKDLINISLVTPAECARKLKNHEADIGLLPVVSLSEIPHAKIISGYGIACSGEVGSVLLVSEVPVGKIRSVLLDFQSRTSVELVKILARKLWKINPLYFPTVPGYEDDIRDTTAAVIIGDRALQLKKRFNYVYDLGLCWFELTMLPFVFAGWTSSTEIESDFLIPFEKSLALGISHIDALFQEQPELLKLFPDPIHYLKKQIQYTIDEDKKKGLDLFLSYLKEA